MAWRPLVEKGRADGWLRSKKVGCDAKPVERSDGSIIEDSAYLVADRLPRSLRRQEGSSWDALALPLILRYGMELRCGLADHAVTSRRKLVGAND
ncbi:MAG: hypothetical protein JSV78_02620 [Phycisphaerales bacterium]|nr:MAG: hypothetical protein JSV78_02620 [Phycisphaerales bacterium]